MPNGADKNLVRVRVTVAGFRAEHGSWPTRFLLPAISLEDLKDRILTAESFRRMSEKLDFVIAEDMFTAEDEQGRRHDYGSDEYDSSMDEAAYRWLNPEVRDDLHYGW